MDWTSVFREVGVLAGLVIFFTFAAWKREERLSARINGLDLFVRDKLMCLIKESNEHLRLNSDVLKEAAQTRKQLWDALTSRPCMLSEDDKIDRAVDRIMQRVKEKENA